MDDAAMTSKTSSSLQALASNPALAMPPQSFDTSGGSWRMVLAMLLSGTIGLLVVESGLPVMLVVWLRCLLGALGLAAWVAYSRQWLRPTRAEVGWLAVGGWHWC